MRMKNYQITLSDEAVAVLDALIARRGLRGGRSEAARTLCALAAPSLGLPAFTPSAAFGRPTLATLIAARSAIFHPSSLPAEVERDPFIRWYNEGVSVSDEALEAAQAAGASLTAAQLAALKGNS
jgi:hypothetical protein